MIPCFSTAEPTVNPGTSCRNTSGMPKASHSHTKRAALSADVTSRVPPSTLGCEATLPAGSPPQRRGRGGHGPGGRAAEAGEAGDHVAGPLRLHREEVPVVHDRVDDLVHV